MRKIKDLNAVNAELSALIARSDVDPEQKKYVGVALNELKRLRRKTDATQADVFFCVRRVAESLLNAFFRR